MTRLISTAVGPSFNFKELSRKVAVPVKSLIVVETSNSSLPWYLAYTKPRQEAVAAAQLARQGYDVYLPLYKRLRRGADGMVEHHGPMFPRYVFFRPAHDGQSIAPVRSTIGVAGIVRFGVTPATMGADLIDALRAFESEREHARPEQLQALKAGQRVTVCTGPLQGLEGLVCATATQRVTVLLDLMGRQPRVQFPHHHLEPVAA